VNRREWTPRGSTRFEAGRLDIGAHAFLFIAICCAVIRCRTERTGRNAGVKADSNFSTSDESSAMVSRCRTGRPRRRPVPPNRAAGASARDPPAGRRASENDSDFRERFLAHPRSSCTTRAEIENRPRSPEPTSTGSSVFVHTLIARLASSPSSQR